MNKKCKKTNRMKEEIWNVLLPMEQMDGAFLEGVGNMTYYFAVYAPNGLCDSQWMIETSDDVKPMVNDDRLGARLNVDSAQNYGYHRWIISC